MEFLITIAVWIALSFAVGLYAHNWRNRSMAGWVLLALAISPLLAVCFATASKIKS